MALGLSIALIFGDHALIFAPLGTIFMRLLKMVIVPLIFSSITFGVASIADTGSLGRIGVKTLLYYVVTSIFAILTGLFLANIIHPGDGVALPASITAFEPGQLQTDTSLLDIFIRMIPTNPVFAMGDGDMLGLIFFSIVLGFTITRVPDAPKSYMITFFDHFFQVMMKMTHGIILLAPLGVFGLMTNAIATTGFNLFNAVGLYVVTIFLGVSIHLWVTLPLVFFILTRINPLHHFRAMAPALVMAFSSSSSGATLPVTMDSVENSAGISNRISSFVLPLGATINMDGTALYECAGVLFIAQVLGIDLSFNQQLTVVITAFLASVGTAAIPSAGLVMIFVVLEAVGLSGNPAVAFIVGTMLAVDRPLDMYRTVTNVFSDSVGAAIIAKSEHETLKYEQQA